MMIPYKVIGCCQKTNCTHRFIKPLLVTMMIFKSFFTFLNQCISHKKKQFNMLKLWDKSEKDIDNQRIIFTYFGALQTGSRN